ncbi:MAG: helix-turn-helix domain-containing protein [Moorea sp. SIO1G6]|uniref:helix-turn-helix domain-containing protein n=1 Tax=Moorena sp. SIO1G6 TaxID=2607840 RepID=UPI0013C220B4|nr:helix-turn-helix domain-containing protein [Moorena sp. SIO1G6]NET66435.1 helix-turn-helix domain-containing protein [Moorena sp. SIO1G6]
MTGVANLNVIESPERLLKLMNQQKTALGFAKVQSLYLWKIGAVETVRHLAVLVGRTERTIHRWLEIYRQSGIEELLKEKPKTGRPKKLKIEQVAKLQQELRDPAGFKSYKEVQLWIFIFWEIWLSYSTVHRIVNQELKAKLKVVRPRSKKQLPGEVEEFIATFPEKLKLLLEHQKHIINQYQKVTFWCSDETRLGLHTIERFEVTVR